MTDSDRPRPKTLEEALVALDAAEAKLLATQGDETGIRRLNESVQRSEQRFRMLAKGVPNHLLFLDRDLRILFANDVFLEAAGWKARQAAGCHISDIVGMERFMERQQYYERALAGETVEYESMGAAGNENGYFHFSYRPSFDEAGNVHGIFSMATDISARRKVEIELEAKQAELVRSNKDLEQFAYVASHDLKAPLRAIELLVQWITEGLAGYDANKVQENLALLGKRTQRLNRLLDDLLAYSRAGRKVGAHRMSDTHALVLDVVQLMNPPQAIAISIQGQLPKIKTHPTPLEQVLRNLIGNAVKHHPGPQGRVVISCEEKPDHYLYSIEDDGEGIPAQYAERVFEMFQTLKPRDQVEGSGMGLAIVNRIVQWQGGRVWFEPAPSGKGTVFKFEWKKNQPLAAKVETKVEAKVEAKVCEAVSP
jgi:PAS domain S-box-containing protein